MYRISTRNVSSWLRPLLALDSTHHRSNSKKRRVTPRGVELTAAGPKRGYEHENGAGLHVSPASVVYTVFKFQVGMRHQEVKN